MDICTEKYLEIVDEFHELEEMLEGMLGNWSMVRVKSKLSKIEYDMCELYIDGCTRIFANETSERIKALEEELKAANRRANNAVRYGEKIRDINRILCSRLEADGLLDKYWGNFESEK